GTDAVPGEFQIAMLLLAILTGFPRQASALFLFLLDQPESADWRKVLAVVKEAPHRIGLGAEAAESLWHGLEPATIGAPPSIAPSQRWAARVARFSFEVGKAMGARRGRRERVRPGA